MPENPFASTLARSAIVARTARTGSGSPTPAAWLRSRLSCSASSASGGIFDVGERAEAGVDAVGRLVAARAALDDGARRAHAVARAASASATGSPRVGDGEQLVERERRAVEKDHRVVGSRTNVAQYIGIRLDVVIALL